MKKLILASAAMLAFAAPLAFDAAAADPGRGDRHGGRYEDDRGRGYDRGRHRGHGYDHGYRDGRRDDWRDDRRDERRAYHQGYRDGHWDDRRYNGYYYRDRWHHGAPPRAYWGEPSYRPGYRAWRRGDHLPSYYRHRYVVVDYHRYGLSRPPHGHHWVRDDRGDYLLVGIATGVILGLALGH